MPDPALTAAEWMKGEAIRRDGLVFVSIRIVDGALEIADKQTAIRVRDPRVLATIVAVANDLLLDGDGRKGPFSSRNVPSK
jgi:hypothetical protein